ncbi:MAG: hypothetical protein WBL87_05055 [Methanothrix sp.]
MLELLAGSALVAGQVMNGADGFFSGGVGLEDEMRAFFSGGLEDHACRINGVNASVFPDMVRIDHQDIQIEATSSAAQTDHAG